MSEADDFELLEEWRSNGDNAKQASDALLRRYLAPLSKFFHHKVSDDVEDLVQTTFLACIASHQKIHKTTNFRAYLFGIARLILLKHLRYQAKCKKHIELGKVEIQSTDMTETISNNNQRKQVLFGNLKKLPLKTQNLLYLYYWENYSTQELAELLGIPRGTVSSNLHRARVLLKNEIEMIGRREITKVTGNKPKQSKTYSNKTFHHKGAYKNAITTNLD